jgi:hypothetical protein
MVVLLLLRMVSRVPAGPGMRSRLQKPQSYSSSSSKGHGRSTLLLLMWKAVS